MPHKVAYQLIYELYLLIKAFVYFLAFEKMSTWEQYQTSGTHAGQLPAFPNKLRMDWKPATFDSGLLEAQEPTTLAPSVDVVLCMHRLLESRIRLDQTFDELSHTLLDPEDSLGKVLGVYGETVPRS
jgi:hypothetical protein